MTTFAVDWAIDPTLSRTGLSGEVTEDTQPMGRPGGVCVTVDGAVVVSEPSADRLHWTDPDGRSFLVGGQPGLVNGAPWEARFRHPLGVAAAPDGSVVVADTENHALRRVAPDGRVTTVAGGTYGAVDGRGRDARCWRATTPASLLTETFGTRGTKAEARSFSLLVRLVMGIGRCPEPSLAGERAA